jgi:hypothetical protein
LWDARRHFVSLSSLDDRCLQKSPYQLQDSSVCYSTPNGFHQYLVVDIVKAAFDVAFEYPVISSSSVPVFVDGQDAFQRASKWSESIGIWQEVCLEDWF